MSGQLSLWASIRRILGLGRARPADPSRSFFFLPQQYAGVTLTRDEALAISAVWGCVNAITNAIAPSPWGVYALRGSRYERLPDDTLDYLLNVRPNPEMTAVAFREALMFSVLTAEGNGYAEIVRDRANRVAELWPLDPLRVIPRREPVSPYRLYYDYVTPFGDTVRLDQDEMYHLRGPSLDGFLGANIIARAARSMSIAAAQDRFAAAYFANNTVVGGVLKSKKALKPEAIARLRTEWTEWREGPDRSHKPLFLEEEMDFQAITNDSEKAELVDSRKFSVEDVCRWYGVPPHKVQHLERSTFNNIEHQSIDWVNSGLSPWKSRLEQEANFKLFPTKGPYRVTRIDLGWLTQGDFKSRMEGAAVAVQNGIASRNEVREKEGWNDRGAEGDALTVQQQMISLDRALNPQEPEARSQAPGAEPGESPMDPGESMERSGSDAGMARAVLVAMFGRELERYSRKIANRRIDLARRAPERLEENLSAARASFRTDLVRDCAEVAELLARPLDVAAAADAVEAGEPPRLAADRFITKAPVCVSMGDGYAEPQGDRHAP